MAKVIHGACACGRNRYTVDLEPTSLQLAEVLFDSSNQTRSHQTTPFTTYLRIPLSWYRSATFAHYPDESPRSIRRTFESPFTNHHTRRQFCGYCGTPLSTWSERTREEADFIRVTLGSLFDEDLDLLQGMGLLGLDSGGHEHREHEEDAQHESRLVRHQPVQAIANARGVPWFEDMVHDTQFGRFKRQRGGQESRDGKVKVEWEVVEYTDDGADTPKGAKRKIGDVETAGDVDMRSD